MTVKFHGDSGDLVKRARGHQNSAEISTANSHEEYARGEIIRELADRIEAQQAAITALEDEVRLLEASRDLYLKVASDFQNA